MYLKEIRWLFYGGISYHFLRKQRKEFRTFKGIGVTVSSWVIKKDFDHLKDYINQLKLFHLRSGCLEEKTHVDKRLKVSFGSLRWDHVSSIKFRIKIMPRRKCAWTSYLTIPKKVKKIFYLILHIRYSAIGKASYHNCPFMSEFTQFFLEMQKKAAP